MQTERLLASLDELDLSRSDLRFSTRLDLDVGTLLRGLPGAGFDVVANTEGLVSVVTQGDDPADKSKSSETFDFHTDGLYHATLPRYVMLYCEDPGTGGVSTKLSDGLAALQSLRGSNTCYVDGIESVYIGKDGIRHARPLVNAHPVTGEDVLCFGSRAYLQPSMEEYPKRDLPTLRDIMRAGDELLAAVDGAVVHEEFWTKGQLVIFDNLRYLHRREARAVDPARRLLRIWISPRATTALARQELTRTA